MSIIERINNCCSLSTGLLFTIYNWLLVIGYWYHPIYDSLFTDSLATEECILCSNALKSGGYRET